MSAAALLAAALLLQQPDAQGGGGVNWTPLKVLKATSVAGAILTEQQDGSLLVSGTNVATDTYTLEVAPPPFAITALRLEALADPSLKAGGPGRSDNGNFGLSEWRLSFGPKGTRKLKPVGLWHATADFAQDGSTPISTCDGSSGTHWMIFPRVNVNHELVAETKSDLQAGPTDQMVIELEFAAGDKNTLGRFRLSATHDARPVRAAGAERASSAATDLPQRVNQAIDRGCDWLLAQQSIDGSWTPEQEHYRNGATALCVYALLKSGIRKDHPAIVRAVEWLRCGEPRETYTLACQILALHSLEDPAHDAWIRKLGEALVANQQPNAGGFDYGFQPGGDLSNTQYAALGLRVAVQHGLKVATELWEKMAAAVLLTQKGEGSGAYAPLAFSYKAPDKPTGSMTAAGVAILVICDEQLHGHSKSGSLGALARRGVAWLGQNFAADGNPGLGTKWQNYWLYGLERVAALLKLDRIGDHDWYREGARWLVDHQKPEGHWAVSEADVLDTCWALLFLTRATAVVSGIPPRAARIYGDDDPRAAISLRASGDAPLTFWISSFGEKTLAEYEWPGEQGRGLHVSKVEWFARPCAAPANSPELPIGKVERDGARPAGKERFGAQWSFTMPGRYRIHATAYLLEPPAVAGAKSPESMVDSAPLEVNIREVMDSELLEYARDPQRNLLRNQKPTITASSRVNDWWDAKFAVDGTLARGWASSESDPLPTLTIELEKPVRASTLLVTQSIVGTDHPSRIKRLQVTFNGKGPPLDLPLVADDHRKSRLKFAPLIIRRIELKVVEVSAPEAALKAVGLAEVELQIEGGAKK